MARKQRVGLESSATRTLLLDAAEGMMREAGYAAVTSRRLGARAGVRPQLVHYYFPSMDELFITLYRRRAEHGLRVAEEILSSGQPLKVLWAQSSDATDVALSLEFIALGNHRKAVRAETAKHGEVLRRMQLEALQRYFAQAGITPRIPLGAIMMILASTGFLLMLEADSGMTTGHAEARAYILAAVESLGATGDLPSAVG
jgi:AcrR family transcriptional regulator